MATPMNQTEELSPSMELTVELTAADHTDISAGHPFDMTFPPTKEQHPGEPLIPHPITDIANISEGDHVLYQIWGKKYRKGFQSGLVSEVQSEQGKVKIITFTKRGVNEESFDFSSFTCLHQVEYSTCRFSSQEAIARAHRRRDMNEMLYNPLNNNGHHFVTNAKTGREYPLSDMILDMETPSSGHDPNITPVVFSRKLERIEEIKPGQHLLFKGKQHLLVESCSYEEHKFTAFIEEKEAITIKTIEFPAKAPQVLEISYEKELCPVVNEAVALQRALKSQECKSGHTSEDANAHVTCDEPGTDTSVSHSHTLSHGDGCPVFSDDVTGRSGADAMRPQQSTESSSHRTNEDFPHDECNHTGATFHEVPLLRPEEMAEQNDSHLTSSVKKKRGNERHSSHFVTEMKTGIALTIDESCLFNHDVAPKSYTLVTPHVAVDEGDHVAVEVENNRFLHGIVLRNMGPKGLLTIPNVTGDRTIPCGFISSPASNSNFFRVNYEQSVSADQTKKRACSALGKQILSDKGEEYFTTWAKTGNALPVNMSQLREGKMQLRQTRPLYRERITSLDDIKVGDHLIQGYPTHWFHFLVSGKNPSDPAKITCIYCLRTKVCECEMTLDLQRNDVYRIQYFETFAPEEAVRRAREEVGKRKFQPHARMWFVRWAKTASDESVEVEFLDNRSMPVSKSQISSFAQLNEGDAIVKKEKRSFAHYYIVTEVISPYQCVAIESYYGLKTVTLHLKPQDKGEIFYRLNYLPRACFPPEDTVAMATYLARNYSHKKKLFSKRPKECINFTSRCFINYVKTGDGTSVDSDALMNDRPLSIRTKKVFSTRELLPGDHIKRPMKINLRKFSKEKEDSESFHHMMVAERPQEDGACCVFHFAGEKNKSTAMAHFAGEKTKSKPKVSRTFENIFENGDEVHRICYPERVDPSISLKFLAKVSKWGEGDDESAHSVPIENEGSEDGAEVQALVCDFEEHEEEDDDLSAHVEGEKDLEVQILASDFDKQRKGKYHLLANNCEHLIMFASVLVPVSSQVNETLYHLLEYQCDIPLKYVQAACYQLIRGITKGGASNIITNNVTSACHVAGAAAGSAIVKAAARTAITEGAESAAEALATAGYMTTLRAVSLSIGATFAFGASVAIEAPLCIHGIYKLSRKKKFDKINKVTFRKECTKKVATSTGAAVGGTAGAIAGTFIPVPFLGTFIGTAAGSLAGVAIGNVTGRAIGLIFKDGMTPDFAIVNTHLYTDYPE